MNEEILRLVKEIAEDEIAIKDHEANIKRTSNTIMVELYRSYMLDLKESIQRKMELLKLLKSNQ